MINAKQKFYLVLAGIATGVVNGLFGGGGGMIVVPLLIACLKLSNIKAHATAILVILSVSVFSVIVYCINQQIDFSILLPVTLGNIAGGVLGAKFLKSLSSKMVGYIFVGVMLFAGIRMVI